MWEQPSHWSDSISPPPPLTPGNTLLGPPHFLLSVPHPTNPAPPAAPTSELHPLAQRGLGTCPGPGGEKREVPGSPPASPALSESLLRWFSTPGDIGLRCHVRGRDVCSGRQPAAGGVGLLLAHPRGGDLKGAGRAVLPGPAWGRVQLALLPGGGGGETHSQGRGLHPRKSASLSLPLPFLCSLHVVICR